MSHKKVTMQQGKSEKRPVIWPNCTMSEFNSDAVYRAAVLSEYDDSQTWAEGAPTVLCHVKALSQKWESLSPEEGQWMCIHLSLSLSTHLLVY